VQEGSLENIPVAYEAQRIETENYLILDQLTLQENLYKYFRRKHWTKYYHTALVLLFDNFLDTDTFDNVFIKNMLDYVLDTKDPTFFYIGPEQKGKQKLCLSCKDFKRPQEYGEARWKRDETCQGCAHLEKEGVQEIKKCFLCQVYKYQKFFRDSEWNGPLQQCTACSPKTSMNFSYFGIPDQ
jgi:hypothetical protein